MRTGKRYSRAGGRLVVGLLTALAGAQVGVPAYGAEDKAVNIYHETVAEKTARLKAENEERAYISSMNAEQETRIQTRLRDLEKGGIRTYQTESGVPLITNRDKYQNQPGYTQFSLGLQTINVPTKFSASKKSIESYTTKEIDELVTTYSKTYKLEKELVLAVIHAESRGNPRAKSPKGACGLMQLMPGTAKDMGVTDIFNPAQNIAGGTQYLAKMLEIFKGDPKLALAAYNAGPGTVQKYGGIPPYDETRNYVRIVMDYWKTFAKGEIPTTVNASTKNVKIASRRRSAPKTNNDYYTVHFKSGLVQPANEVRERDDEWYELQWGDHAWPVRKDLVKEIIEPS